MALFIRQQAAIARLEETVALLKGRGRGLDGLARPEQPELAQAARDGQAKGQTPRLGKSIAYARQLREALSVYLDDAAVPIDNNACKRALRAIAVGPKNHFRSRSRQRTEVVAIIYTLVESAKLSGVSPHAYLEAELEKAIEQPGAVLPLIELKNTQPFQ